MQSYKIIKIFILTLTISWMSFSQAFTLEKYDHLVQVDLEEFFDPTMELFFGMTPYPHVEQIVYNNSVHLVGIKSEDFTKKIHILKPRKMDPNKKDNQKVMARIDVRDFGLEPTHNYELEDVQANDNILLIKIYDSTEYKRYIFKVSGTDYNVNLATFPQDYRGLKVFSDTWVTYNPDHNSELEQPLVMVSNDNGNNWSPGLLNNGARGGVILNITKLNNEYYIQYYTNDCIEKECPSKLYKSQNLSTWHEVDISKPISDSTRPQEGEGGLLVDHFSELFVVNDTLIIKIFDVHDLWEFTYWYSKDKGNTWIKIEHDFKNIEFNNIIFKNSKLHMVGVDGNSEDFRSVYLITDEDKLYNKSQLEFDFELIADRDISLHAENNNISVVTNTSRAKMLWAMNDKEEDSDLKFDMDFFHLKMQEQPNMR